LAWSRVWMAPSARVVVIDEAQRNRLEAVVRARTAHVRDVQRAQIVLGAADGMSNVAIARALSICQNTVRTWRRTAMGARTAVRLPLR